jgi:peptidoglycan/LPS O-acetylase OafA/YrhL
LLHNFDRLTLYGINGSFWSIAVEAQLYLIYPLLLCLVSVCGWRVSLVLLFITESAIRLSVIHGISPLQSLEYSPFGFWFSWTLGSFLADCYLHNKLGRCRSWLVWLSLILAIAAYCFYPLAKFQFMAVSLFTAILVWRLIVSPVSLPSRHHCLNSLLKHFTFLGTVSFSFYLIHQPFLQLISRFTPRLQNLMHGPVLPLAICLALYPLILMLSSLMCKYVELPSSAVGKSLSKLRRFA